MELRENVSIGQKTTMRIGGNARYFVEPTTKEEIEEAWCIAKEKGLPLIVLGGGSNTVFADGTVDAVVLRIKADAVQREGNTIKVQSGKNLAMLINELAKEGLDLSPLTGILGTVGGAIFGNAGQGPTGIWIDSFVQNVTALIQGEWKSLPQSECEFAYRESMFKHLDSIPIIWEVTLDVPSRPSSEIAQDIEKLLQKRIETQPHIKTAGSCFKAVGDTPAWKLIDAAQLRGHQVGTIRIAEKHANFLINEGNGTYEDTKKLVQTVREKIEEPLEVEMRFYGQDGTLETV